MKLDLNVLTRKHIMKGKPALCLACDKEKSGGSLDCDLNRIEFDVEDVFVCEDYKVKKK